MDVKDISYNDWVLESEESSKYNNYETWSFRYKNYSKFKLVVNYKDKTKGDSNLINLLKEEGILKGYYTPTRETIKNEYEKTTRAQTDYSYRKHS